MSRLSTLQSRRTLAGFARHGVFILLGLVCVIALAIAAAPKSKQTSPPIRDSRSAIRDSNVLDEAWKRLDLSPGQRAQVRALRAKLERDQRETIRRIKPKAEVLRRELQIAEATPGQQPRAALLRGEVLRLTAPLQERHAAFVKRAKALLSPGQKRQLEVVTAQIKAEKQQGRGNAGGQPQGGRQ
jgi:Spy/CpxP family protein refolding chaperone